MRAWCTSSWGAKADREELDVAVKCGDTQWARYTANQCSQDPISGSYCGEAVVFFHEIDQILSNCPVKDTSANCSGECAQLLKTIRNDFGCCINTIFNNTDSVYPFALPAFTHSLWLRCGVQPIKTICNFLSDDDYHTYNRRLDTMQPSCTQEELEEGLLNVTCTKSVKNLIFNELKQEAECDIFMSYFNDTCSLDENGMFCLATTPYATDIEKFIAPIVASCNDTTSCSSECKNLLTSFGNSRGCCVNAVYNSTFSEALGINATTFNILGNRHLFKLCDVSPPPLKCKQPSY